MGDLRRKVIFISDMNAPYMPELAAALEKSGAQLRMNLNDADKLDAVINVCTYTTHGSLLNMTDEALDKAFENIILKTVRLVQKTKPILSNGGSIINIGTSSGEYGEANMAAYAVCMAGLGGLTRELATDLAPEKIRVNLVLLDSKAPEERLDLDYQYPFVYDEIAKSFYPSRTQMNIKKDIAPLIAFLCCDHSSSITARSIFADGGQCGVR